MSRNRSITISQVICTNTDTLWKLTQDPAQHQRWDARFGHIEYEPPIDGETDRRLRYSVSLLPGIALTGTGTCSATRTSKSGVSVSAIRFASESSLSLLRSGSGYWRYAPVARGIEFSTKYDYCVRWGRLGEVADLVWRPVMARITAWSFDRLRLWAERGIRPERSMAISMIAWISMLVGVAAVFCAASELRLLWLLASFSPWLVLNRQMPKARRCLWAVGNGQLRYPSRNATH